MKSMLYWSSSSPHLHSSPSSRRPTERAPGHLAVFAPLSSHTHSSYSGVRVFTQFLCFLLDGDEKWMKVSHLQIWLDWSATACVFLCIRFDDSLKYQLHLQQTKQKRSWCSGAAVVLLLAPASSILCGVSLHVLLTFLCLFSKIPYPCNDELPLGVSVCECALCLVMNITQRSWDRFRI